MAKKITIGYTEIKHPFAHLVARGTDSTCLFFKHTKDEICSWDDLVFNYPRWTFSLHTRKEALIRITEMVKDDNWELIETSEDELKPLERMT